MNTKPTAADVLEVEGIARLMYRIGVRAAWGNNGKPLIAWKKLNNAQREGFRALARWHLSKLGDLNLRTGHAVSA